VGNFVLYSDDFGRSWNVLGSATESCAPKGDEPKCEELPDGSVLLSSRKHGGRYFNVFRYTNEKRGEGVWGYPVDSRRAPGGISNEGTPCNGEILIVEARRADGKRTHLALQSIPAGPNRSNVTIYWKELAKQADYLTPMAFASHWQGSYQVSTLGSAYSTMTVQADGRIGFFYDEEPKHYQMVYRALGIDESTGGKYKAL
jgi:sialidase-1